MIERVLWLSVKFRAIVLVFSFLFLLIGFLAFSKVPIDAVPDVTNVQVQVMTSAPSLGPLDVETYVTTPVERAMAGLPDVEEVRSISRPGVSVVTLVFEDHVDLFLARQLVDQRLAEARKNIPDAYGTPSLGPISSGLGEIFHFEVKAPPDQTLMDRKRVLDWQIAPRLKLVPGVVEVNTYGGETGTLQVTLDPAKLAIFRLDVSSVLEAIRKNHVAVGGGYLINGKENLTVRGEGRVISLEDLGNIVVETREDRTPLYLKQVAEMEIRPIQRYGSVIRNGDPKEAVVGIVMMLRGANSRAVVQRVRETVVDIQKSLPEGYAIDPFYDRTDLVNRTIRTVSTNLLEAIALVLLVLLLTLANFRAGIVVALVIPLALVGIFVGMWIGGVHGNLISLGAIDFGLVVDGAIIIVENALHRLGEKHALLGRPLTTQEHEETVFEAAKEVRKATAFGEAIIALVYVPILVLTGVEGRTFRPMAMTVLFALGSAFVLSLTFVPALSVYLLPKNLVAHESSLLAFVRKRYEPILARALRAPKTVFAITILFFAATLGASRTLGSEFLPKLDEGTLIITMVRLPSVSLDQAKAQDVLVAKTLKQFPEVTDIVARTGRAEVAIDAMAVNMTDTYVFLKPRSEWTTKKSRDELLDTFDKALRDSVPGAGFSYTQPIEMNTNDLLAGIQSDVAVHVYGYDPVELRLTGERILRKLKDIPGAKDVKAEQIAGSTTLNLNIDRVAVARAGIDASRVLDAVSAIGGVRVVDVLYKNVPTAIQVRFSSATREDRESVLSVPVKTSTGMIPLGQLVRAEEVPSPSQFSHERLSRRLTVQLNVRGRDVASFVEEAKVVIDREVKLPTGFFIAWAGEYERLQSAKAQLAIVVPVALTLILVLLMLTFGTMRPALLIFANVPVAISGGILALVARGITFSISAAVGFIALFGIAVLNGLVLVSALERLREEGQPIASLVHDGAVRRLRPVLTTALVASLGFLPMAIADGAGAEVQRPLATVVIGGILTSTILTLIVLPVAYAWMWRKKGAREATGSSENPTEISNESRS